MKISIYFLVFLCSFGAISPSIAQTKTPAPAKQNDQSKACSDYFVKILAGYAALFDIEPKLQTTSPNSPSMELVRGSIISQVDFSELPKECSESIQNYLNEYEKVSKTVDVKNPNKESTAKLTELAADIKKAFDKQNINYVKITEKHMSKLCKQAKATRQRLQNEKSTKLQNKESIKFLINEIIKDGKFLD